MEGYTTVEQSKELLELGLPASSADMFWNPSYLNGKIDGYLAAPGALKEKLTDTDWEETDSLPCWSFHRLLNIILWQDYDMRFFGCPMNDPMKYVYGFIAEKLDNGTFKRFDKITWGD